MAVPTISGRIRMPDNSVYAGPFHVRRLSGPMFNGTTLVGITVLLVTTNSFGDFTVELHPGDYEFNTLVAKYPGYPPGVIKVRVPDYDGAINFADLERLTNLVKPHFFGGEPVIGGDLPTATTTLAGKVKINVSDPDPVVVTKSSLDGSATNGVIHKPVDGSLWIRNSTTGNYHRILCSSFGGIPQLGVEAAGTAFALLPAD